MTEQIIHIAQINIAAMRFPLDHAEMAPFVAQLDSVNALADGAPGQWAADFAVTQIQPGFF